MPLGQFSVSQDPCTRIQTFIYKHRNRQIICIFCEWSHSAFIHSIFVQQTTLKDRDGISPQGRGLVFGFFPYYLLLLFTAQYNRDKILLWDKGQVALLTVHHKRFGFFTLRIPELCCKPTQQTASIWTACITELT